MLIFVDIHIVGALMGYDLTDAPIMINQYDSYVKNCSLKALIRYVCKKNNRYSQTYSC